VTALDGQRSGPLLGATAEKAGAVPKRCPLIPFLTIVSPKRVDPGDGSLRSTSRWLALTALLTWLVLAASLLTRLVLAAALLLAALARLLIGLTRLLLATLVRIVCLVHALLLLPPA
jgi:hypothetical protein